MKTKFSPYLPTALTGLVLLLLAACATPVPPPAAPTIAATAVPPRSVVEDLLSYHRAMNNASQAELNKELAALNTAPAGAETEVRKAIVLGLMHDAARLARARIVLNGALAADDVDKKSLRPLIEWMQANYAELRRLTVAADRQAQQYKEGQKDAQRRYDQLNEKLEAMKRVENSLPASPVEIAPAQ